MKIDFSEVNDPKAWHRPVEYFASTPDGLNIINIVVKGFGVEVETEENIYLLDHIGQMHLLKIK